MARHAAFPGSCYGHAMASRTSRKVLPRKRVGKDRTNGPVQLALFSEEKAGSACSLPGGAPGEPHIGIDEAGRGCLAGPVVAAAVLFPEQFDSIADLPGLDDSKKLREAERERLAELAAAKAAAYGIGFAWQGEIDHINILNATFRAMSRAVLALAATAQRAAGNAIAPPFLPQDPQERAAVFLLPRLIIDGNAVIPLQQWHICIKGPPEEALAWECFQPRPVVPALTCAPDLPEQVALVGGDALVPAISAASILAKTVRDALMVRLDAQYPGYGLARHKGYGTREHLAALAVKGPCALHRRSFRRVRLEQEQCRMR